MHKDLLPFAHYFFGITSLLMICLFPLGAQTNTDICADRDCPTEVMNIQLEASPLTGPSSLQRTTQFKTAYQKLKQLKAQSAQKPGWTAKYDAFQLGGKSCLRMYQLESCLAYEYEQNADFKSFVKSQEAGSAPLREQGFAASRRGLNLQNRMKNQCPDQIKQVENQPGTSLQDLPAQFMKLGQLLGYFDQAGNPLKPLDDPKANPAPTGNKKTQIANLQALLNNLPVGQNAQNQLNGIQNSLNTAKPQLGKLIGLLSGLRPSLNALKGKPGDLLSKLGPVNQLLGKLKGFTPTNPQSGLLAKIGGLYDQGQALAGKAKQAADRFTQLKQLLGGCIEASDQTNTDLVQQFSQLGNLQNDLNAFQQEKIRLQDLLSAQPRKYLDEVTQSAQKLKQDVANFDQSLQNADQLKARLLAQIGQQGKCKDDVAKEIDDAAEHLKQLEQEQQKLAKAAQNADAEVAQVKQAEAQQAAEAAETERKQALQEALKQEEQAIQTEFKSDITLDPVPIEEWTEGFEVKRPYWEAVFHPDDEVVAGNRGRYFLIQLKDAEQNVKLLFGPGEYFMQKRSFRDTYGATVAAFVTEALHAMKKSEQGKVKLFVQGSADIAGDASFRGQLDSQYEYREVNVLPMDPQSGRYLNSPVKKAISDRAFRNTDLPDLRGNYLREMISIYSRKLKPVQLEGAVQEVVNEADRNAIIYLFIPEEVVSAYEE